MTAYKHHEQKGPESLNCAVLTISDTRTEETDDGGKFIAEALNAAGHKVQERRIIRDEAEEIKKLVSEFAGTGELHLIITTGGTGIASRDNTIQTLKPLMDKTMEGFGELFRSLSYEEIGSRAMLSRAAGGVVGNTLIFCLPGSLNAVKLGMEKLILPDLGHLVWEVTR
ncbi:MAG: molybdenum cofactor biosynthesis protein MoaB [Candidatus Marinimicrobia bacterium]|nr:molybdenum cofactor biosynthesis protein MoaB [Candidatus Neomarinimicrobiota bacterium]